MDRISVPCEKDPTKQCTCYHYGWETDDPWFECTRHIPDANSIDRPLIKKTMLQRIFTWMRKLLPVIMPIIRYWPRNKTTNLGAIQIVIIKNQLTLQNINKIKINNKSNKYLAILLDAILIICNHYESIPVTLQHLQYELLRCGIVVTEKDLIKIMKYMTDKGIVTFAGSGNN